MKFKIEITVDNAAFHDDQDCTCDDGKSEPCSNARGVEVRRLMRDIEQKLDDGYTDGFPYDFNGNKVGTWGFSNAD
jgi:hypothetical protein